MLTLFLGFIAVAGVVGYWCLRPGVGGAVGLLGGQTGLAVVALVCLRATPDDRTSG